MYLEEHARCDRLKNSPIFYMRRRLNGKEGRAMESITASIGILNTGPRRRQRPEYGLWSLDFDNLIRFFGHFLLGFFSFHLCCFPLTLVKLPCLFKIYDDKKNGSEDIGRFSRTFHFLTPLYCISCFLLQSFAAVVFMSNEIHLSLSLSLSLFARVVKILRNTMIAIKSFIVAMSLHPISYTRSQITPYTSKSRHGWSPGYVLCHI